MSPSPSSPASGASSGPVSSFHSLELANTLTTSRNRGPRPRSCGGSSVSTMPLYYSIMAMYVAVPGRDAGLWAMCRSRTQTGPPSLYISSSKLFERDVAAAAAAYS